MGLAAGEQKGVLPNVCPSGFWDGRKKGNRYPLQDCPRRLRSSLLETNAAPVRTHGAPCERHPIVQLNPNYGPPFTFPSDNASGSCCRGPGRPSPFQPLSVGHVDTAPVSPGTGRGWSLPHAHGLPSPSSRLNILQHQTLPQVRFPTNRL